MKVDQDVSIDDEPGREIDGAAHGMRNVVGEKAAHLVAEGEILGVEQEIHGAPPNSWVPATGLGPRPAGRR